MEQRYLKNIPAISEAQQKLLSEKKVFIAGCGGLGGYLLEYCLRLGAGEIVIADGDKFDNSNLNRQLLADTDTLGKLKTTAAEYRCSRVNPDIRLRAVSEFITGLNAADLIDGCDVVLDGLDSVAARKLLVKACRDKNIPYIYGSISGWTAQAALIMPGDRLLDYIYPGKVKAQSGAALSFTPALCAAMEAAVCLRLLCGEEIPGGELFCFDLKNMDFQKLFF